MDSSVRSETDHHALQGEGPGSRRESFPGRTNPRLSTALHYLIVASQLASRNSIPLPSGSILRQ